MNDPTDDASNPTPTRESGDRLEQLERAMAVLEAFGLEHPSLTVSEVAQLTGITRAAARRILLTLRGLGYLRSDGRDFSLTPRVLNLGWPFFESLSLPELARPILEDAVAQINESCSVAMLEQADIVYIARSHPKRIMTISGGPGSRLPAYCTASGRVLLSSLEDTELTSLLNEHPPERHTQRTITDPAEFTAELERVRSQGWALVDQELEIGLRAIAVPITARDGQVTAALSASSNSARTSVTDLRRRCLPAILKAAALLGPAFSRQRLP